MKVTPHNMTIEQKRKISEWKLDSLAKSLRTLAEEATANFGRNISFLAVAKVLKKKDEIMSQNFWPRRHNLAVTS